MIHLKKAALLILILAFSACSNNNCDDCIQTDILKVIERVDIKAQGVETQYFFNESLEENPSEDLVTYNYYGPNSSKIDFKIHLANDMLLLIKLVNQTKSNPWQFSGDSYSIFANQDLDEKEYYVTVELVNQLNNESPLYLSNIENQFPNETMLNVFTIEKFDLEKMEILCSINKMKLQSNNNTSNILEISGTFRGALTFL